MRKVVIILLVLCLLLATIGCAGTSSAETKKQAESKKQTTTAIPSPTGSPLPTFTAALSPAETDEPVPYHFFKVEHTASGNVTMDESGKAVQSAIGILCDHAIYGGGGYHDSYLVVRTNNGILIKDLSFSDGSGCYTDSLSLHDFDGDGLDEMEVRETIAISGGGGQYSTRIFKVSDKEISTLFDSEDENGDMFDTGFSGIVRDGFRLEVRNSFTGYKAVFDVSKKKEYQGTIFDEKGYVKWLEEISCDTFYEASPEDVDKDGMYEFVCTQYVSLEGHSDYIGDAYSVLKFDKKTKTFHVVKASFDFQK